MKNALIVAVFTLALTALALPQAKADTWTSKYLVDQATSAVSYFGDGFGDSRGNKWFYPDQRGDSLGNHLYKYDGSQWTDYTTTYRNLVWDYNASLGWPSGGLTEIFSMCADRSGNVWLPGSVYDGSNWSAIPIKSAWEQAIGGSVDNANFSNVFCDSQGNVYMVGSYNISGNSTYNVLKRTSEGIWSIAIPMTGPLAASPQNGLLGAYDANTGDYWLYYRYGNDSGVYRYHGGSWTNYTTAYGLPSNAINNLKIDSKGNIWVATNSGVAKFDGTSWTTLTTDNSGLAQNSIGRVSEDSKGRIWFAAAIGQNTQSGVTIFDPSSNSWDYYSAKNGLDDFTKVTDVFFFGDEMWGWTGDQFVVLNINDTQSSLYGQTSGDVVSKAGFDMAKKKKKKTTTINSKAITIYKITRVKKKKKYKTVKTRVYRSGVTQWYKALNLDTGKYQIVSKARGKKKHTTTINITSGDPYRLDLRY